MTAVAAVVVTPFAAANIRNPVWADRWLAHVREKILSLDTLPESHETAKESAAFDAEVRQVLVGRGTPWKVFGGPDASFLESFAAKPRPLLRSDRARGLGLRATIRGSRVMGRERPVADEIRALRLAGMLSRALGELEVPLT